MSKHDTVAVLGSPRFLRDYRALAFGLVGRVRDKVPLLLSAGDGSRASINVKFVKGVGPRVFELDLSKGDRLLAARRRGDGALVLLRVGDHTVVSDFVGRFSEGRFLRELELAEPLPPGIDPVMPRPFVFPALDGESTEVSEECGFFRLDAPQTETLETLVSNAEEVLLDDFRAPRRALVLGGPGTGKTILLLSLLAQLSGGLPGNPKSWDMRLIASDRVLRFLSAETGWRFPESMREVPTRQAPAHVVLVDDADSVDQALAFLDLADISSARQVVVALDPLQLQPSGRHPVGLTPATLDHLTSSTDVLWLRTCYRQTAQLGKHALDVLRTLLAQRPDAMPAGGLPEALDLRFVRPGGHLVVKTEGAGEALKQHGRWLAEHKGWGTDWPPVVLVIDDALEAQEHPLQQAIIVPSASYRLSDVHLIKGLEYGHAVVVLARTTYESLSGERALQSRSAFVDLVLRVRLPYTRARESVGVFVLDP